MPLVEPSFNDIRFNTILYPNPTSGDDFVVLNIDEGDFSKCELLNATGQVVKSWNVMEGQFQFQWNDELASGMYLVRLTGKSDTQLLRLIVSR